jgi:hypothetical protein
MITHAVIFFRSRKLVEAAFAAGKRAALREAADMVAERASLARTLAPTGSLGVGLIRGQVFDQVELELRSMAGKVK